MSIVFKYDGALLPYQSVRFAPDGVQGLPASAWYGEPMTAGVRVDDPSGTIDLEGWHTFTVDETACSKPRIFTGWILGRTVSRGPYVTGAGRIWDCDIIDQNALFSFDVFRAATAKRPAETDIVRAAWALGQAPLAGTPIYDNGRANFTDNPVNFGDADYVTQYPVELFNSIAGTSGKNFYAYWDDAAGQISLFYDLISANAASTLRLSNVFADYDGVTTFAPAIDATLERSPLDRYTGVLFGYRGGYVYARRQTTIDDLSPSELSPVNFLRDLVYRTDRVGRLATAQALVQDSLTAHSVERDTLTCMVQLPASKVNLIQAGDQLDVKFSHLPGYTTFTGVAVIRRNVIPTAGTDDLYDVHLELSNTPSDAGPGGGGGGGLPYGGGGGHWWEGSFIIPGDGYAYSGTTRSGFEPSTQYNFSVTVTETPPPIVTYATNVGPQTDLADTGLNTPDLKILEAIYSNVSGNMTLSTPGPGGDTTVWTGTITTHSTVDPLDVFDMRGTTADGDHSGTHSTSVTFWFDPVGTATETLPPSTGQPVGNEVPTPDPGGGTTTFTTANAFADGSLHVEVDGIDQTDAVTGYDGSTGVFTLSFDPKAWELVRVWYQGR